MRCLHSFSRVCVCATQYVAECFSSSSLFHKALKEAFESFCNKQVAGSSSAELMANFCDNLLKKVHSSSADVLFISMVLQRVLQNHH